MKSSENLPGLFRRALLALSPNCKETSRLQSKAVHQSLPLLEKIGLRIHLLVCAWCRRYAKNIRFLREVVDEPAEQENCGHSHPLTAEAKGRITLNLANHYKNEPRTKHD